MSNTITLIMNNFKTEVPKKYQEYSPTCAYTLMDLENAPDTEEAFQRRLGFFKKLISEKGIQ